MAEQTFVSVLPDPDGTIRVVARGNSIYLEVGATVTVVLTKEQVGRVMDELHPYRPHAEVLSDPQP